MLRYVIWGLKYAPHSPNLFLAAMGSWVLICLLVPSLMLIVAGLYDKNNRVYGMAWSGFLLSGTIIIALIF